MRKKRKKRKRKPIVTSKVINIVKDADINNNFQKQEIKTKQGFINNYLNPWINPDNKNTPREYKKHLERSVFVYDQAFDPYVPLDSSILDIGCNCGRDLNYLYRHGYKNLTGIDVSKDALNYVSMFWPEMMNQEYEQPLLIHSPIEDIIKHFEDLSFNVVYCFSVLMHLPDELTWIFEEMKRITKNYIIIVEDDKRNYSEIFSDESFSQIASIQLNRHIEIDSKFKLKVFERNFCLWM